MSDTASGAEAHPPLSPEHERLDAAVRANPGAHRPRLEISKRHRGTGFLDETAQVVNRIVGSMYVFVAVTVGIVVWLFAGNIVGFDKTPWPLLLTILNLPQLSIMISLQVSANLAQRTSDARAVADHRTLIALHELSKQQIAILESQNKVLDLLRSQVPPGA
jgi:low affinity Fe/Cu permease